MEARYRGRSVSIVWMKARVRVPRYIPLPPTPARTRPTISAEMLGAAPQRADAASNRRVEPMNSHLVSNVA